MDEIRRRDIVEEVINPVFTINLVLNVPEVSSSKATPAGQGAAGRGKKARVKWAIPADETASPEEQLEDDESEGKTFIAIFVFFFEQ